MSVTYDGKFRVSKAGIEPCCAPMHLMQINGMVYKSPNNLPMIAIQMNPKKGRQFTHCPFCGAEASE